MRIVDQLPLKDPVSEGTLPPGWTWNESLGPRGAWEFMQDAARGYIEIGSDGLFNLIQMTPTRTRGASYTHLLHAMADMLDYQIVARDGCFQWHKMGSALCGVGEMTMTDAARSALEHAFESTMWSTA